MYALNKAQLIGNLTRDPETKTIPSGQAVARFAVATNRRWKDTDGNQKEDTQFHECVAWGKMAELATSMLTKGKKVYVEGRLQTDTWEGNDGVKKSRTEIVVENFIPLSPREGGFAGTDSTSSFSSSPKPVSDKPSKSKEVEDKGSEISLDDIPF